MDYLVKVVIFGAFLAMVYFAVDFFIDIVKEQIDSLSILPMLCQLGVLEAFGAFFSILATSFVFRHILNFIK